MGNDGIEPEGETEYQVDNYMKMKLFGDRWGFLPVVRLRARIVLWWKVATHPTNLRQAVAGLMEFAGLALLLGGLYLLHTLAFIIGLGVLCLLLAQGITSGRGEE